MVSAPPPVVIETFASSSAEASIVAAAEVKEVASMVSVSVELEVPTALLSEMVAENASLPTVWKVSTLVMEAKSAATNAASPDAAVIFRTSVPVPPIQAI